MSKIIVRLVKNDTEEIVDSFPADNLPQFIHNQVGRNRQISLDLMLSPNGKYLDVRIHTETIHIMPICPICEGTVGTCNNHSEDEWKNAALTLKMFGTMTNMTEEVQ